MAVSLDYTAKATIACTLTSLTTTNARETDVVDNTTNKFLDALLRVKTNGQAGSTGLVDIYVYTALSDTGYSDGATGSNAAFTAANRRNARYLGSIQMATTTQMVSAVFSIASVFGGILPSKWGLIIINNSGGTLSATAGDHVIEYEGIKQLIAA